jgi:hypothetical protein
MTRLIRIDFDTQENPEIITVAVSRHEALNVSGFLGDQHYAADLHPYMAAYLNDLRAALLHHLNATVGANADDTMTIALTASQAAWVAMFLGSPSKYLAGQPPYAHVVAHVDGATQDACSALYGTFVGALNPFAENDYKEFAR